MKPSNHIPEKGYDSVMVQSSMALDALRNKAYLTAMKEVITPSTVVLDLGCGLGTLGLMAAQLGAKKVYMVDPSHSIRIVPRLAEQNRVDERIECFQGKIQDTELPEKVDLIISVMTGNFLLSENLLPALFYARDTYLKPGGRLLPNAADMWAVPVSSETIYQKYLDRFSEPHLGLDISPLREIAANHCYNLPNATPKMYMAPPTCVKSLDFYSADEATCHETLSFISERDAECHGFLGWFDLHLDQVVLSTSPEAKKLHWSPILFMPEKPIKLEKGTDLEIKIDKGANTEWSWRFRYGQDVQQHSYLKTLIK